MASLDVAMAEHEAEPDKLGEELSAALGREIEHARARPGEPLRRHSGLADYRICTATTSPRF
jgi:hypothetical protein